MSTVYAWTAPGANYPGYVNVSDADDAYGECTVRITVRAPKVGDREGATASVTLPSSEYAILVGHLRHHFDETLRSAGPGVARHTKDCSLRGGGCCDCGQP